MIEKILKFLRLWPFHRMKLGRLTRHWLAQRGALDAVHEMYMAYWREYVVPREGMNSVLKDYSQPRKIDILMGEVHPKVTWVGTTRSLSQKYIELCNIHRAVVEKEVREGTLLLTETD